MPGLFAVLLFEFFVFFPYSNPSSTGIPGSSEVLEARIGKSSRSYTSRGVRQDFGRLLGYPPLTHAGRSRVRYCQGFVTGEAKQHWLRLRNILHAY